MFSKSNYLIKEHAGILKLTDKYDVIDPENGEVVAYAKENIPGWSQALRLLINKKLLPTTIEIRNSKTGELQYVMKRPVTFFRSKVTILDKSGNSMGYFKSRVFTLKAAIDVFSKDEKKVADVKGSWTGWDFTMCNEEGKEIGKVTKKWAGLGKEFFTSADNYMVSLNPSLNGNPHVVSLLLMAGLAIDVIYKEKN